ncbi:MAG TPA: hypothetical protein VE985_09380 [Gaiellaceae bacterium]|nr:hypothetical protein [Gaiellaceae bacterium]
MGRGRLVAASAIAAAVALPASGCGAASHRAATGHTTVQRYDIYPADTISVPAKDPQSKACRQGAVGISRASVRFVAHYGPASVYPADLYYVLMREELADFEARRCDPKLLGRALAQRLTAAQRHVLVRHAPRPMALVLRRALSAAGA